VKPKFDRNISVMEYGDAARSIILAFKHGDKTSIARFMARLMLAAGGELVSACDAIVPVPIHFYRLVKRKYNQAGLVAQIIGRKAGRPVFHYALLRSRATESQGHKSAAARLDNVRGAFKVRKGAVSAVAGKKILLIDDVFTTGATLAECVRALKRAGAKRVYCLTFAKA
jgi:ComF family protein